MKKDDRKWISDKIYKDDKTIEQISSIQLELNKEFLNITQEVKNAGGIKKWKLENNIVKGYIVLFGSSTYYRTEKIYFKKY